MLTKCPHCGGLLFLLYDGYSWYYECVICTREYELKGNPRRVTPKELEEREGIHLTAGSNFL